MWQNSFILRFRVRLFLSCADAEELVFCFCLDFLLFPFFFVLLLNGGGGGRESKCD